MILKNYTYLAHTSNILFYVSSKKTEFIKEANYLILFSKAADFKEFFNKYCLNFNN